MLKKDAAVNKGCKKRKEQEIYSKMNNYPVAERQFVELKRRQEIIQGVI